MCRFGVLNSGLKVIKRVLVPVLVTADSKNWDLISPSVA